MGRVTPVATFVFLAAIGAASGRPFIPKRQNEPTTGLTFADITPSTNVNWVDCYAENLQCTYLTVPLDYTDSSAGTTDVAFIRYLLDNSAEDLLFNPGGPGEGGVEHVISYGESIAKKWGYNFISFDPRGVKNTGPRIACSSNQTAPLTRRQNGNGGSLKEAWDTGLKTNKACSDANKYTNAKYVGTSAVVQDMMHFTKLQAEVKGEDPEQAHINFYGVSYGTGLGQTLVAMYPDRIRRVLLDANIYGVSYYQGWEPSTIDDVAHGVWLFSKLCFEAGPEWCVLAEGQESINNVHARFDKALAKLEMEPMLFEGATFDHNTFLGQVQQWMYFPRLQDGYSLIANATLAVENDDSATLTTILTKSTAQKRDNLASSGDELTIITAVDVAGRYPWTNYEDWKAAADQLASTAPYGAFGYSTGYGLIGLAMDSFVPPESQIFPGFQPINTSFPVLFVNTVADPVTPRSSANQMSLLFEDSIVIIQNSPGHGISNAPSKCTTDAIDAYFIDGKLPAKRTWCEHDVDANYFFGGLDPTIEQ